MWGMPVRGPTHLPKVKQNKQEGCEVPKGLIHCPYSTFSSLLFEDNRWFISVTQRFLFWSWNLDWGLDAYFSKSKRYSCSAADAQILSALHRLRYLLLITACQCLLRTVYIHFLNIHSGHTSRDSSWRL